MSDRRVLSFLNCLRSATIVNVLAWAALPWLADVSSPWAQRQWLLAGVYVFGCAFRSYFPVVYVKRFCIVDRWVSSIALGRTIATVAEVAFAFQVAGALELWSERETLPWIATAGLVVAGCFTLAQVSCWYGVATGRYLGELIEESLWTLGAAVVFAVASWLVVVHRGAPTADVFIGWLASGVFVTFMLAHNLPMYVRRVRAGGREFRGFRDGVVDMVKRREVSLRWVDWAGDAAWQRPYFTLGVWLSMAIVLLPQIVG